MLLQIATGSLAILTSVALAGAVVWIATLVLTWAGPWLVRRPHAPRYVVAVMLAVTWIQAALTLIIWLWALLYLALGLFPDIEAAFYFAIVCFTTLGFGDVLLPAQWQLLAGFAAADGLLLFGLFTAFLVDIFRRVREEQRRGLPDPE